MTGVGRTMSVALQDLRNEVRSSWDKMGSASLRGDMGVLPAPCVHDAEDNEMTG